MKEMRHNVYFRKDGDNVMRDIVKGLLEARDEYKKLQKQAIEDGDEAAAKRYGMDEEYKDTGEFLLRCYCFKA